MRRMAVNMALDLALLDEPVAVSGVFPLSLRRVLFTGLAVVVVAALYNVGGVLLVVPGGLEVTYGLLAGIGIASPLILAALQGPRAVTPESMAVLALTRPPARGKADDVIEDYTVRADPDTGIATVELAGYALDPATMEPLGDVAIVVDGRVYEVDVGRDGRYRIGLELPRGVHQVSVRHGNVELRRVIIRVT
ncbi:MAG: hypothetical protein GSR78_04805 [Desulfurococcales archaeon]|nr:hypothetical protein [Desulfurococcales archaeon]